MSAETILIVDDESANRESLTTVVEAEGYHAQCAASGTQAIAAVLKFPPDLILLDVTMPGMDGYEVASVLKRNPATASIPIIMVTANAGRGARVVGLGTGAEDYLIKPIDCAELALKVRNLLRLKSNAEHGAISSLMH